MDHEERQRRLDRVRLAIWAELLLGLVVSMLSVFAIAAPAGFDWMSLPSIGRLIPVAPVVSLLAWVWMLRLSRGYPEAGERSWRYRDRAA
jgi:hypothetical protein